MSSLQVLVATMNEKSPVSLFQRMNLASDALIINQSNIVSYEEYEIKSNKCECYTFNNGFIINCLSILYKSVNVFV